VAAAVRRLGQRHLLLLPGAADAGSTGDVWIARRRIQSRRTRWRRLDGVARAGRRDRTRGVGGPQTGNSNNYAGTLSTAGGIVFYGQASGEFAAVGRRDRRSPLALRNAGNVKSSPMTYVVNGRQYVAIASGANVLSFALP